MRLRVWSLAWLGGLRIQHCHKLRRRSKMWLGSGLGWLWCRPAAVALILPLAWEPPNAVGGALKKNKIKTKDGANQCQHLLNELSQSCKKEALDLYVPAEGCQFHMAFLSHLLPQDWVRTVARQSWTVQRLIFPNEASYYLRDKDREDKAVWKITWAPPNTGDHPIRGKLRSYIRILAVCFFF